MIIYRNTDEAPDASPDPIDVKEAENARFEFEQWKKEQIHIIEDYLQLPWSRDDKEQTKEFRFNMRRLFFLKNEVPFLKKRPPIWLHYDDFREWYNDEYLVEYNRVKWYLLE